jgi:hypothetical protein
MNIGYPRSGTTWLWRQLNLQPWFSCPTDKENYDLIKGKPVSTYYAQYVGIDISANFCPLNFALDRYLIGQLSGLPSLRISIILRNPFEIFASLYHFNGPNACMSFSQHCREIHNQMWFGDMAKILRRWRSCFDQDRLQVFCYDDLKQNPVRFFNQYCERIGLPAVTNCDPSPANAAKYHDTDDFDLDFIAEMNCNIDDLAAVVPFQVQHWKKG